MFAQILQDAGIPGKFDSNKKNFMVTCPWCSHHKPKCGVLDLTGAFKCLVCGEKGGWNKLARELKLSVDVTKIIPQNLEKTLVTNELNSVFSEKPLSPKNLAYSYSLDAELCGLGYLQRRGLDVDFMPNRPAVSNPDITVVYFPHFDRAGNLVAVKMKYLDAHGPGKHGYSWEGANGDTLYVPDWTRFDSSTDVTLVEGCEDALALYQLGINAVALNGATQFKNAQHPELKRFSKVYVCMDNDPAGQAASAKLVEMLGARAVGLPPEFKDPNDWVASGKASLEAWRSLTRSKIVVKASDLSLGTLAFLNDKDLVIGQPTGFPGVDELLGGGKRLGEITVLTAEAKVGKTAFLNACIYRLLQQGISVGYASREMDPATEIVPNMLSIAFSENAWLSEQTEERKIKYVNEIGNWPLYFTKGFGYLSFAELKEWVLELKSQGVLYFILDHLLLAMSNPEDFKEVSVFMRELKALVNEERIHIDLVVQPQKLQLGQKIGMGTLRGGANIAQALNTLFTLERVPGLENVSKLELEIARSRLCKRGKVYLQYDPKTMDFIEVTIEEDKSSQQSAAGPSERSYKYR